jgi:hypothetical protein
MKIKPWGFSLAGNIRLLPHLGDVEYGKEAVLLPELSFPRQIVVLLAISGIKSGKTFFIYIYCTVDMPVVFTRSCIQI